MKVLDLFSGLGGWSSAFKERGHEVLTIDNEPRFRPTICADIGTMQTIPRADVVLLSPPCQCFSVATIGRHWEDGKPKTRQAVEAIALVQHTLDLVDASGCRYWIMENPRAMLRKVIRAPGATISYCQYGERRMKPTDLWGVWPWSFVPRPMCRKGDRCHVSAPRGSRGEGSTQGMANSAIRAKIPNELSLQFCLACENPTGRIPDSRITLEMFV